MPKYFLTLIFFFVSVLVSGCSTARLDPALWQDQDIDVVWPPPPQQGRIRLLKIINGPEDVIEAQKGAISRFFDYFVGDTNNYTGFYTPQCIAADGGGLIYVADPSIGVVHRYDLANREVSYLFRLDNNRTLVSPVGVALDSEGNIYVSDSQLASVFKFNSGGEFLKELSSGSVLKYPAGIILNSKGEKLVADIRANKIFVYGKDDLFKGELILSGFTESFNMPTYIAVDSADRIYVTDTMNFTVRVFDSSGKYLRSQGQIGDAPGSFARPKGIALDSDQNLYVMDSIFGNFQIFNQKGQLLLYAGQEGTRPGEMMLPSGIFIDNNDRIYVADTFNHRLQIFQYLKEKVQK